MLGRMLPATTRTRSTAAVLSGKAQHNCNCHLRRQTAPCKPLQAVSGALESTSSQQPSGAELWDMGIADCEAESCGLVPNGSLVLVRLQARLAYQTRL